MTLKKTPLNKFVEKILHVSVPFAGMGGASGGIIGASSTNEPLLNQLRSDTLAFAATYTKPDADTSTIQSLASRIEGGLRSVQLINGLSDTELQTLLNDLYELLDANART